MTQQVPRKMVVDIGDDLFKNVGDELKAAWDAFRRPKGEVSAGGLPIRLFDLGVRVGYGISRLFLRLAAASFLGLVNVVGWVVVVFAAAAPMILSGLYEATVDRQVLHGIEEEVRSFKKGGARTNDPTRVKYHVHLLFAVLVGNLELRRKPKAGEKEGENGHAEKGVLKYTEAWVDVGDVIQKTLLTENPSPDEKKWTETRLNTMLSCQASFGATIGAPVAFFLGSFLFAIFGNLAILGDNDTSHALAFGEWWMTIPHVAIVAGCLLAGNNPNTLEAIVSGIRDRDAPEPSPGDEVIPQREEEHGLAPEEPAEPAGKDAEKMAIEPVAAAVTPPAEEGGGSNAKTNADTKSTEQPKESIWKTISKAYSPFYSSDYQPVWMWERGRSKRNWIDAVQAVEEYQGARLRAIQDAATIAKRNASEPTAPSGAATGDLDERPAPPKRTGTNISLSEIKKLYRTSIGRVRLPFAPQLGVIAWTGLILTASVLIIVPMVLAYVTSFYTPTVGLSCRTFTFVLYFVFQICLTAMWFIDFPSDQPMPLRGPSTRWTLFFALAVFFFFGSAFTALIGTFMQILGVYRNCKCSVPMGAWASGDYTLVISTNSAQMIYYANLYWLGTGVASMVLLIIFCYLGWWYQRHWRTRFRKVVTDVLSSNLPLAPPTKVIAVWRPSARKPKTEPNAPQPAPQPARPGTGTGVPQGGLLGGMIPAQAPAQALAQAPAQAPAVAPSTPAGKDTAITPQPAAGGEIKASDSEAAAATPGSAVDQEKAAEAAAGG